MLGGSKTKTPTLASWGRRIRTLPAWGGHSHSHPYQREQQYPGPHPGHQHCWDQSVGGAENRTTSPHLEEEKHLTLKPKKQGRKEKKKKCRVNTSLLGLYKNG